jgi:hypothetical protein
MFASAMTMGSTAAPEQDIAELDRKDHSNG